MLGSGFDTRLGSVSSFEMNVKVEFWDKTQGCGTEGWVQISGPRLGSNFDTGIEIGFRD